ncbi:hypothetical protein NQ317_006489 [Molorchus minor]|uniref:Calpain catalytic domain-containing protein n=1 Tax=Molorchus minor TaxID=1323400 RepID=A0ABQ9J8Q1_9CUCU|nr:hypothetical protein NQ317_006489 [Molorchus minor]
MSSPTELLDNAVEAAKKAVQFDQECQLNIAAYYYEAAARLLEQAAISDPDRAETLNGKATEYKNRANELQNKTPQENKIAIDEDEQGDKADAVKLYTQAIEYITQYPDLMQGELKTFILRALDRAEELKGIKKNDSPTTSTPLFSPSCPTPAPILPPNIINQKPMSTVVPKSKPGLHRGSSAHLQVSGQDTYTDEEKLVLLHSSKINKRDYMPFMSVDLAERFQYAIPFTDKDGLLILSPKQKRDFHRFVRPEELCTDPCIVYGSAPNYLSIKQTVISDCSFVASLAVSASYESRFGRKLITTIIYPQTKDKKPVYNPFGKYMIKLHFNGVARKVIIDDTFPIDRYGRLLCSYSSNKSEFWISLLEKAYMKVMGGYDFPGSNSNIDLHALTGWVPERVAVRLKESDFNKDSLFATLESRLAKGDVLVTVATGRIVR